MAAWMAATRQAANFTRHFTSKSARPSTLIQRRGVAAGGGDHHELPKVNFWEDPMHPSKWKEEHYAIVTVTGCGLLFYGGYKFLTKDENHEKAEGASQHANQ